MKHPNATTLFSLLSVFTVASLLSGCASQRKNPHLSQSPDIEISKKDFNKMTADAEQLWQKRNQKDSLLNFIRIEEELSRSNQQTREHLIELARAHYLLAEYHGDSDREKSKHWEEGANWAEKALTENPKFKQKIINEKLPPEQALSTLTTKDAEALYWFAVNLGRWASKQGLADILKYKDRVKKMIDRVQALSPNYFYGGIYRYYGVYYALIPGYTEEDLKNSRKNFETALKKYPEYFSNHVLYAQYYAAKVEDDVLFKKHLNFVVKGNPKNLLIKDAYPEQLMEQARAKRLLEQREER